MPSQAQLELTPKWVDPVAIERFCSGREVGRPLTHAERLAAAVRLVQGGWTVSGAAEQTRISPSTVEKRLAGGGT